MSQGQAFCCLWKGRQQLQSQTPLWSSLSNWEAGQGALRREWPRHWAQAPSTPPPWLGPRGRIPDAITSTGSPLAIPYTLNWSLMEENIIKTKLICLNQRWTSRWCEPKLRGWIQWGECAVTSQSFVPCLPFLAQSRCRISPHFMWISLARWRCCFTLSPSSCANPGQVNCSFMEVATKLCRAGQVLEAGVMNTCTGAPTEAAEFLSTGESVMSIQNKLFRMQMARKINRIF